MSSRYERLDALRGAWMLWMAGFHFCFDLAWFRLAGWDFYRDPVWTTQRTLILSGFLFWAGLSQGLALAAGQSSRAFWRRWTQIAAAALLVSLGSWVAFPRSWISFGVLHAFVLLLPLLRFGVARWPAWALLALALVGAALPWGLQHPLFDSRWTNWVGLVTHKPITEDFVPLLPWLAPAMLGLLAARRADWLRGSAPGPLVALGRWPLSFYLLHQPVLLAGLTLWQRTMGT